MFKKVLVANRHEIAIRAFRAAFELGVKTVAVYSYEDRDSLHRLKADEAYQIGSPGNPVAAYLDIDEIMRVARLAGVDAIYPGYGFLSENAKFAAACEREGIKFIGPSAEILSKSGDKVLAKAQAERAGVPVLRSSEPGRSVAELSQAAEEIGYPVFVKAVAGGGGRGMRRVDGPETITDALTSAMSEARSAFGDDRVFIEQCVLRPRHIEVQIMADSHGGVVHLFERDCSVQRRHQKVVEIAPAPNLDDETRSRLHADAVRFARSIKYENAGTVEFLLETEGDRAGEHVFIEMNPRVQVEHTVTEEITDRDIVTSQFQIAAGAGLDDIGLTQNDIWIRGAAIQCRITTEDPRQDFRPGVGIISAYRSAGGAGIRIDGGSVTAGTRVLPYFDSLLVKLIAYGDTYHAATRRAQRALAEFRVRGVATNIPFLQEVLANSDFEEGDLSTHFITEHPQLMAFAKPADRASKMLQWLGEVTVNRPYGLRPAESQPELKVPGNSASFSAFNRVDGQLPLGQRDRLQELGPQEWAKSIRESNEVLLTDTTFRDAHQSLLATRMRTFDLLNAAPYVARELPQLYSVEAWGGATFDVALRFLGEDPWQRLAQLREAMPNIPIQMLLRGDNTVGYTPYPDEVTEAFVAEAIDTGIDIFRVFDAMNNVARMRTAIDAVLASNRAVVEGTLCYAGNILDPKEDRYTLDYYLRLAEQIVHTGAHVLAIKDMAGLLRPEAAYRMVSALRSEFDLPVHLHTHDTTGGQLATLLSAISAGVDAVDAASAPLSGTTSQPSLSALVAALEYGQRESGIALSAVAELEPYWEAVRRMYAPFESGLPAPTGRVYHHEIPGGQLSNLRQQATALGLSGQFELIEEMYAAADRILGRIPKVTPSSKVVGDLALHLVAVGADPADFEANPDQYDIPDSVIRFLAGELGELPGGWPEPFRTKALANRSVDIEVQSLTGEHRERLCGGSAARRTQLNELLFPGPTAEYARVRDTYGDLSVLPTSQYLYGLEFGEEVRIRLEEGVDLFIKLEAIGQADEQGIRKVLIQLNGHPRHLLVRDETVESADPPIERADPAHAGHLAAPFAGVVNVTVKPGETVQAGDRVAVIEAMKMEASITSPISGRIARVTLSGPTSVAQGDLLAVVEEID